MNATIGDGITPLEEYDPPEKPVEITFHARRRMIDRGGTDEEVILAVRSGTSEPAKRGKWHSSMTFEYNEPSPVNDLVYAYKTVDAVFAEEEKRIVVVTVKVYYHNVEGQQS